MRATPLWKPGDAAAGSIIRACHVKGVNRAGSRPGDEALLFRPGEGQGRGYGRPAWLIEATPLRRTLSRPAGTLSRRERGKARQSSLAIVPVPVGTRTVAPLLTLLTVTRKVSFASTAVSPLSVTANVREVWPAGIVSPTSERAT